MTPTDSECSKTDPPRLIPMQSVEDTALGLGKDSGQSTPTANRLRCISLQVVGLFCRRSHKTENETC